MKELKVAQESLFKWVWYDWNLENIVYQPPTNLGLQQYSAFTVAELWTYFPQFLPNRFELTKGHDGELSMGKNDPKNGNDDYTWISYGSAANFDDDNPANSSAKLLIYLLENKLISQV